MLESLVKAVELSVMRGRGTAVSREEILAELGAPLFVAAGSLHYADLPLFCLPGMRSLGLTACIEPENTHHLSPDICIPFYLQQAPVLSPPVPPEPARRGEERPPLWADHNPAVFPTSGAEHTLEYWIAASICERPMSKSVRLGPMLLRWCALEASRVAAASESLLTGDAAANCLEAIAGKQSNAVHVRMRRAAAAIRACQPNAARRELTDAVCIHMYIPTGLHAALLCPPEERLSPVHRRELIYAARSGTSCLRAMAAARLSAAAANYEVLRTLEQLKYDDDAWVRSAAGILPPSR